MTFIGGIFNNKKLTPKLHPPKTRQTKTTINKDILASNKSIKEHYQRNKAVDFGTLNTKISQNPRIPQQNK